MANETIQQGLKPYMDANFVDVDPTFHVHVDEDYDARSSGVTRESFCRIYHDWIVYCTHSGHLVRLTHMVPLFIVLDECFLKLYLLVELLRWVAMCCVSRHRVLMWASTLGS